MRKLLIYLLLFACFESFISSTSCYCCRDKKLSNSINMNVSEKDETLLLDDASTEIHPLDIFTLHYFQ